MVRRNVKFGIETNRTLRRTAPQIRTQRGYLTKKLNVSPNYTTEQRQWLIQDIVEDYDLDDGGLIPTVDDGGYFPEDEEVKYLNAQSYQSPVGQLHYSLDKQKRWLAPSVIEQYIELSINYKTEDGNLYGNEDIASELEVTLIEHETNILLTPRVAGCIGIHSTHTDEADKRPSRHRYFANKGRRKTPVSASNPELVYEVYKARPADTYPAHKQSRKPSKGNAKSNKKKKGQKEKNYYFWNGYHRNDFKGRRASDYYDEFGDWFETDWHQQDVTSYDVRINEANSKAAEEHIQPRPVKQPKVKERESSASHSQRTNPKVNDSDKRLSAPTSPLQPCQGAFRCLRCGSNKYVYINQDKDGEITILLRCEHSEQQDTSEHDSPYQLKGTVVEIVKSGWLDNFAQHQPRHLMVITEEVLRGDVNHRTVKSLVGDTDNVEALRDLMNILNRHVTFARSGKINTREHDRENETHARGEERNNSPLASPVSTPKQRTKKVKVFGKQSKDNQDNHVTSPSSLEVVGVPAHLKSKSVVKARIRTRQLIFTPDSQISETSLSSIMPFIRQPTPPPHPKHSGALIGINSQKRKPTIIRGRTLHLELSRRKRVKSSSVDSTTTSTTLSSSLEVIGKGTSISPTSHVSHSVPTYNITSPNISLPPISQTDRSTQNFHVSSGLRSLPDGIFKQTVKITSILPPIASQENYRIRPRPPNDREIKRYTSNKNETMSSL